jgi:hypothetical protein
MVNRLSAPWRKKIVTVALMGLDPTIAFQITPFAVPEVPVRDEVERLRIKRVLCFYGVNERDSLCRQIRPGVAVRIPELRRSGARDLEVVKKLEASAAQWRHSRVSAPPGRHPGCEGAAAPRPMPFFVSFVPLW